MTTLLNLDPSQVPGDGNSLFYNAASKKWLPGPPFAGTPGLATVTVAASNSSAADKAAADYVCDGVNDEVELRAAVDSFLTASGRVLLAPGDYNLDSWWYSGSGLLGYFMIPMTHPDNQRHITIEGVTPTWRTGQSGGYLEWTYDLTSGAVLHVTAAAYAALNGGRGTVIGGAGTQTIYPGRSLTVNNIGITYPGNQQAITGVSGEFLSRFAMEHVTVSIASPLNTWPEPVEGCVGFRGMDVSMYGYGYYMNDCAAYGMRVGFEISGEHLIMERCIALFCWYGYTFGGYSSAIHPNTLINCSHERCTNGLRFLNNINRQTVSLINYNVEQVVPEGQHGDTIWVQQTFASEETPGQWYGTVTYTVTTTALWKAQQSGPFWEPGSGINFDTQNTTRLRIGSTSSRPAAPDLYQKYIDTTIGKELTWWGGAWHYPGEPDTTPPTAGTLASSAVTDTSFTLTVTGAADETELDAAPYAFSTDNGATYSAWQAAATFDATGKVSNTAYTCTHKVRDAQGNEAAGDAITVTTEAAPVTYTELFADDFNRANGPVGANWTLTEGTGMNVASNALIGTAGSANGIRTTTTATVDDNYAEAALSIAAGSSMGVFARSDSTAANFYGLRYDHTAGTVGLMKRVAGVMTSPLGTNHSASLSAGDVLRLECRGDVITGYVNGSPVVQVQDTSVTTGVYGGCRIVGFVGELDDFAFGEIT